MGLHKYEQFSKEVSFDYNLTFLTKDNNTIKKPQQLTDHNDDDKIITTGTVNVRSLNPSFTVRHRRLYPTESDVSIGTSVNYGYSSFREDDRHSYSLVT